jgi:holo-[acyl-carrier protein] synthase
MTICAPPLIGIDLLEPARLQASLERTPELRATLFLPGELAYCEGQAKPLEHLAARFCAKEAVVKALGIDGWDPEEIEVLAGGECCSLALHGAVAARAEELGVAVSVSLTHLAGIAGAVALAVPMSLRPR